MMSWDRKKGKQYKTKEEYLIDFWEGVTQSSLGLSRDVLERHPLSTKALYCDITQQKALKLSSISSLANRATKGGLTIAIVENINPEWIVELGTTLDIDVAFFHEHMLSPAGSSPWQAIFSSTPAGHRRPTQSGMQAVAHGTDSLTRVSWHADGVFNFGHLDHGISPFHSTRNSNFADRHLAYHPRYGWQAATRMSYCKIYDNLDLFLVDAPVVFHSHIPTTANLHFPVSDSRGGLVLPQIFGRAHHSLYDSLEQFFTHSWHFDVLSMRAPSAEAFLYLVVVSTWTTNLRHLHEGVKQTAFRDIRRPSRHINDRLHDYRQILVELRTEVANARKWMPTSVREELEKVRKSIHSGGYVGLPDEVLNEVLEAANIEERFLMDTFQLLMSSISVLDSETSIRQARAGQKLTWLVSIYVPLTFVTSIFGMNIKEINGSAIPWWACIVTLMITISCTVGIVGAYNWWEKRKERDKLQMTSVGDLPPSCPIP